MSYEFSSLFLSSGEDNNTATNCHWHMYSSCLYTWNDDGLDSTKWKFIQDKTSTLYYYITQFPIPQFTLKGQYILGLVVLFCEILLPKP